jgi:hypothetical protein
MALDTAKGFVPALLATFYAGKLAGMLAGGAAMIGRRRPLFLRFARGGKVVATCGRAFLGVAPLVGGHRRGGLDPRVRALPVRLARVDHGRAVAPRGRGRSRRAVAGARTRDRSGRGRGPPAPREHRPPAARTENRVRLRRRDSTARA